MVAGERAEIVERNGIDAERQVQTEFRRVQRPNVEWQEDL
jgi:hypothetical protein